MTAGTAISMRATSGGRCDRLAHRAGPVSAGPVPWDEIDPGIVLALHALADRGIDTFASCQGGPGHPGYGGMPAILFHGDKHAGLWAVWLLEAQGFRVQTLSRHWDLDHGVPRQPVWWVTLRSLTPMPPGTGTIRVHGEQGQ